MFKKKTADTVEQSATKNMNACARILGRIALIVVALAVQALFVPGLSTKAPFFAIAAFAVLVVVRARSPQGLPNLPPLSVQRIVGFVACHAALGAFAYNVSGALAASRDNYSFAASLISLSKLLVLVPSLLLFPADRKFVRQLAPELTASLIVLFTYSPARLFQLIWPTYSHLLGATIASVSAMFVSGVYLLPTTGSAIVVGPALDMYLDVSCSGISGLTLFQLVFGMIVALEWNRIKGARALVCYAAGGSVFLLANCVRLVIVFVTGNLFSASMDLNAYAWVLFVVIFLGLVRISHQWLMLVPARPKKNRTPEHGAIALGSP